MQVSKQELGPELKNEVYGRLVKILVTCRSESLMESLLEDLLTDVERTVVAKRLAIAVRLQRGMGYQKICDELKVSPPTVAKVKQWMKFRGEGYRYVMDRLAAMEK